MKDEIKEILESLEKIAKCEYYPEDLLYYENCQKLLDYIINLQEELEEEKRIEQESLKTIQKLEEKLYNLTHYITGRNYNEVLKSEQDYKSRNEKAIEYIRNHQLVFELSSKKQIQYWFDMFYEDLINILQGEDKDE